MHPKQKVIVDIWLPAKILKGKRLCIWASRMGGDLIDFDPSPKGSATRQFERYLFLDAKKAYDFVGYTAGFLAGYTDGCVGDRFHMDWSHLDVQNRIAVTCAVATTGDRHLAASGVIDGNKDTTLALFALRAAIQRSMTPAELANNFLAGLVEDRLAMVAARIVRPSLACRMLGLDLADVVGLIPDHGLYRLIEELELGHERFICAN